MSLARQIKLALFLMFIGGGVFFIIGLIAIKPAYRSKFSAFVMQKNLDPASTREIREANAYAATVILDTVYGDLFRRDVLRQINSASPSVIEEQHIERKDWQRMLDVAAQKSDGLIRVAISGQTQASTEQMAGALSTTLERSLPSILNSDTWELNIYDGPTIAVPVRNVRVVLFTATGALVGLLFAGVLMMIFPQNADTFLYPSMRRKSAQNASAVVRQAEGGELKHRLNHLISGDKDHI